VANVATEGNMRNKDRILVEMPEGKSLRRPRFTFSKEVHCLVNLVQDRQDRVQCCSEHCNKYSGFIKGAVMLQNLSVYQLFGEDSAVKLECSFSIGQ
jgi:hypothetical protein